MAASHNPLLTTLTSALSGRLNPDVNLVDTLNGRRVHRVRTGRRGVRQDPPATIDTLKTDAPMLTDILTYHVVPGRLSPPSSMARTRRWRART